MNTHFAIAIHALTLLASANGQMLTSKEMAGSINTNPVFLQRILRALRQAGLIDTQRGAGGGNLLLKTPEQITLYRVYEAVAADSELFKMHEMQPCKDCEVSDNISSALEVVFTEVDKAARRVLDNMTVADTLNVVRTEAKLKAKQVWL